MVFMILPQKIFAPFEYREREQYSRGLQLSPLSAEDFSVIIKHADILEPGDHLVGPPVPVRWPVSTREEAQIRLRSHMAKQLHRYMNDPSVKYLKVSDESGSIVSVAR